jgi:hypothetical protein
VKSFLQHFGSFVLGILHGFDRLRFRGSKRQLCYGRGADSYLGHIGVKLVDYKPYAIATTDTLCEAIETDAKSAGIFQYLNSSNTSKEETALAMAAKRGQTEGRIAVLSCVEPCQVLQVRKDPKSGWLEPKIEIGKCLHYYHYYLDRCYGLRYTRLQSWFPFTMHIGFNGRDWLAQQMTEAGMRYDKWDNCFTWVEDWQLAQQLLDRQQTTAWASLLDGWANESHPWLEQLLPCPVPYYWAVQEAEYATDIAFATPEDLQRIYPQFVRHAVHGMSSTDVLRYMGYRVRQDGCPRLDMAGEVTTTIKKLLEGTCVKHRYQDNQQKMYDKVWQVLRLENLLMHVQDFKVFRTREGDPDGAQQYLPMRKGIADMYRRAEVGRKINERYAEALAAVEDKTPLAELTKALGERAEWKGRKVRALNPLAAEDGKLLEAVNRGEFAINGFRNRDLRALLFAETADTTPEEEKRQSAKVTRLLRLLRAHRLIQKVPKTHRYQLTATGRTQLAALLAARQSSSEALLRAA